ncbi:hypothetical protein DesyoDRAFT_2254 [Desulfosporosinus youngiae DSM 17734]|uniref:Uncharacterized protein n=1 Tax=Desulfosporosinus youngiae DSM 17734 TaxID=768710 RepID=H5XUA3_9FIRM|nr:hypothetical protein DesyoDRAFT_2254 [Desulfosporosinus youngiae DSM 17734]
MQLDSWIFLFLNLTFLLAVSGLTIIILKSSFKNYNVENLAGGRSQVTLRSLNLVTFKKYLVIRRLLKQKNDDDSPFPASLV